MPLSQKSGKRSFLEPSGPVQACNGTAFPLPFRRKRLKAQVQDSQQTTEDRHVLSRVGGWYICEAWVLPVCVGYRLEASEKEVLWRIF